MRIEWLEGEKSVLISTSKAAVDLDDQKREADLHLIFDSPEVNPETGLKCMSSFAPCQSGK